MICVFVECTYSIEKSLLKCRFFMPNFYKKKQKKTKNKTLNFSLECKYARTYTLVVFFHVTSSMKYISNKIKLKD